jgi:hypothetical protein
MTDGLMHEFRPIALQVIANASSNVNGDYYEFDKVSGSWHLPNQSTPEVPVNGLYQNAKIMTIILDSQFKRLVQTKSDNSNILERRGFIKLPSTSMRSLSSSSHSASSLTKSSGEITEKIGNLGPNRNALPDWGESSVDDSTGVFSASLIEHAHLPDGRSNVDSTGAISSHENLPSFKYFSTGSGQNSEKIGHVFEKGSPQLPNEKSFIDDSLPKNSPAQNNLPIEDKSAGLNHLEETNTETILNNPIPVRKYRLVRQIVCIGLLSTGIIISLFILIGSIVLNILQKTIQIQHLS